MAEEIVEGTANYLVVYWHRVSGNNVDKALFLRMTGETASYVPLKEGASTMIREVAIVRARKFREANVSGYHLASIITREELGTWTVMLKDTTPEKWVVGYLSNADPYNYHKAMWLQEWEAGRPTAGADFDQVYVFKDRTEADHVARISNFFHYTYKDAVVLSWAEVMKSFSPKKSASQLIDEMGGRIKKFEEFWTTSIRWRARVVVGEIAFFMDRVPVDTKKKVWRMYCVPSGSEMLVSSTGVRMKILALKATQLLVEQVNIDQDQLVKQCEEASTEFDRFWEALNKSPMNPLIEVSQGNKDEEAIK